MSNQGIESEKLVKHFSGNLKQARDSQNAWRQQAVQAYNFYAGNQWTEADAAKLREEERPAITFNRTVRVVNAVVGLEIQNRQTVVYLPREPGDAVTSELLTGAADWVRDNCDAEDEESQAFKDAVICGLGWTETRLSYENDPDGEILIDRIDPLEMYYDPSANKRNLDNTRWRARARKYTKKEFKELWPDADLFSDGMNQVLLSETDIGQPIDREEARFYRDEGNDIDYDRDKVTVYQYQYWVREPFYRVDNNGQIEELNEKQFKKVKPFVEEMGLTWVKQTKRRYKQAFIYGDEILEEGDCPIDGFTFNAITGLQDRNNNSWFGLMQLMHDPQMYANKWLSQILYILNTNPAGGYFYESGAITDIRRFKNDISHPAKDVQLNAGGLDKIRPKNQVNFPAGIDKLLNYAVEAINDLVGVNLEMLGVANRNQAGVLESQRKEAGVTILADFFDALRRYRKEQGRVLADFILKYIADGRLIKISGSELGRYVPLLKENLNFKYDIVVDDMPTSPNVKEKTFDALVSLMPQLMQAGIPIPPEILDYAPLPADLVLKWKQLINEPEQPDPIEEIANQIKVKLAELEVAQKQQDLQSGQVDMVKKRADVEKTMADAELDKTRSLHELALAQRDRQLMQVDQAEAQKKRLNTILDLIKTVRG